MGVSRPSVVRFTNEALKDTVYACEPAPEAAEERVEGVV